MIEQQKPHDINEGDHAANDPSGMDWAAYHANSETITMPSRRKDNEKLASNYTV